MPWSLKSPASTVYLGADQIKHQSSASLAFVRGIHRGPVNSLHKWPVTRKMFSFDDVIMNSKSVTSLSVANSLWDFVYITIILVSCFLENVKTIGKLRNMLWTNEISWYFSLKWVSERYPKLQHPLDFTWLLAMSVVMKASVAFVVHGILCIYIYIWIRISNYLMIMIYCLLHNLLILMIYCLFYRYNVFYRSWFLLSRCVRVCLARWQPIFFSIFYIFRFIFFDEHYFVFIQNSLNLVPDDPINHKSVLIQVIACCW